MLKEVKKNKREEYSWYHFGNLAPQRYNLIAAIMKIGLKFKKERLTFINPYSIFNIA